MEHEFRKSIHIAASAAVLWNYLTEPALMNSWMYEQPLKIVTDWKVGSPVSISMELEGKTVCNTGTVLHYQPHYQLRYTHLSSISGLPERAESYAVLEFRLEAEAAGTTLMFSISNFATEVIYRHLVFYWNATLGLLKETVERASSAGS